ncbi:MAG: hypothetical protein U1E33_05880 [Rhodospirillales bacterium]
MAELSRNRLPLRWPLQRLGVCFVERFDRRHGTGGLPGGARQRGRVLAAVLRRGHPPAHPGLLPFRMGAFACAVEADCR